MAMAQVTLSIQTQHVFGLIEWMNGVAVLLDEIVASDRDNKSTKRVASRLLKDLKPIAEQIKRGEGIVVGIDRGFGGNNDAE